MRPIFLAGLLWQASLSVAAACDYPDPVVTVAPPSRYSDAAKMEMDSDAEAQAKAAMAEVGDFIRLMAEAGNMVLADPEEPNPERDGALACAMEALAAWAAADALAELATPTAELTIGSRLAGTALAMQQMRPLAQVTHPEEWAAAQGWLSARLEEDANRWTDQDGPARAARNNLRGWAALALIAGGDVVERPDLAGYGTGLAEQLLCTALEDGAFPEEMTRGKFSLHYQLHMLSALAPAAALSERQPPNLKIGNSCKAALKRAAGYAISEIENGGAETAARTGQTQSYFDGTTELTPHHMAWIEAYLAVHPEDEQARRYRDGLPWISNSMLGGDQTIMW